MKSKLILTAALLCVTLFVPLSLYGQSQDFQMNGTVLVKYNGNATNVTIPSGVTAIGDGAFAERIRLTTITIPSSVTSIGEGAFMGCVSLTSITIPSRVTSIGEGAFFVCMGLTSITVDTQNPAYSSLDGILFNKNRTLLVTYPAGKQGSYTIPSSVTSIGHSAFSFCGNLTSVTIPSSVTTIGDYAFYVCEGLTSITIPSSVTSIGEMAFYECTNLRTVTVSRMTRIGVRAFPSTAQITYNLLTIREPSAPVVVGNHVIFTADSSLRRVGVAFAHENFNNLYWLSSLDHKVSLDALPNTYIDSGIQFYVYQVPENISELAYRLVVNGLWTVDPANPLTKHDPVSGLIWSIISIPTR